MSKLTNTDIQRYRQRLRAQHAALREHIQSVLRDSKRDELAQLADRVHDRGEESVADLLASTSLALIDREVGELGEVEEALQRIRVGTYGECETCGDAIERDRLDANPIAKRCVDCEREHETRGAGGRDQTPSL
jgi:RNA polymerase-binding protein DksA